MSSGPSERLREGAGGGRHRSATASARDGSIARDRVLGRVREALGTRPRTEHPGPFGAGTPDAPAPLATFRTMFASAGGEVEQVADEAGAAEWVAGLAASLGTDTDGPAPVAVGRGVPPAITDGLPQGPPETAAVGVSLARGAVAETGSLLMDARDGRRAQLLPPVHVVVLAAEAIHPTLRSALLSLGDDLPSAIGLHSGPSKSADLGQVLVTGVHGPGRVIALVVGE